MIKNFFVKTQSVKFGEKGLLNFLDYLEDPDHDNHKGGKTEEIIPIKGKSREYYLQTLKQVKNREFSTFKRKKGGRPISSYCQSFCFSLPSGIKPSKQQYHQIIQKILIDLSKLTEIDKNELLKNSFINIHKNQNQHINLVISKIFNNGVIDLSKKSILRGLKHSFNTACLEILDLDKNNYKPQQNSKKRQTKTIYGHKLKKNIKNEIIEDYKLEEKLIKRYLNYLKRYKDRVKQEDITKKEKNKKYMNNTIIKIKNKIIIENLKNETKLINPNYLFPS